MKVHELISLLQTQPPDREVIEGLGFPGIGTGTEVISIKEIIVYQDGFGYFYNDHGLGDKDLQVVLNLCQFNRFSQ